jgi:ubiquinone/menaquinone biosynthesis C-methylase UbiE
MKETYKNYFGAHSAAARYAKGRPRFHSFVIEKIRKFLAIEKPLQFALDVGCGTGLSSAALKQMAETVVGIDISAGMLGQAEKIDGIVYLSASAEELPLLGGKFDLITISQAIHWVDREMFFSEAGRVLKPGSLIAAYDNYFQGQMSGNPAFNDWYREEFLTAFPVPPRGPRAFAAASENARDFVLKHEEFNENTLEFSAQELVDYLVTISNVIAMVENGSQSIEDVYDRLTESVKPFFKETRERFTFINPIWYLRRNA